MTHRFKHGDRVTWSTPEGRMVGKIAKRLTHTTYVRGHKVAATPGDVQYLVKSDRSDKSATHKPG
jgi:DUF2945 family protein